MRAYALIDQKSFINNIKTIKNMVSRDSQIMAMVKGNCYGHGIGLLDNLDSSYLSFINYFGVAILQEGVELLKYKLPQKIVIMSGFYNLNEFEEIYKHNFQE